MTRDQPTGHIVNARVWLRGREPAAKLMRRLRKLLEQAEIWTKPRPYESRGQRRRRKRRRERKRALIAPEQKGDNQWLL